MIRVVIKKKQFREIQIMQGKLTRNTRDRFKKVLLLSAVNIAESSKEEIQHGNPRTGHVYRKKSGRLHRASAPGEYPASDTGQLVNSIHAIQVSGLAVRVGAMAKHGKYLEEGTSKMAKRPWLLPELEKELPTLRKNINAAVRRGI